MLLRSASRSTSRSFFASSSSRLCNLRRSRAASRAAAAATTHSPCSLRRCFASVSAAELKFSQPVHETHPHILQAGELTPGITAQEYADRRARLASELTEGGDAILQAAPIQYKSGSVFHPYRQESGFFWLTGWQESDAIAIVKSTGSNYGDYRFYMFVRPKHQREEQWSGYRNGVDAARDIFNADDAWPIDSALDGSAPLLLEILRSAPLIYTDVKKDKSPLSSKLWASVEEGLSHSPAATSLQPILDALRAVKSPAEIAIMRKAGQISGRAITEAMKRPWTQEKDLHAFLDYQFTIKGCDGPAYIPVVAGGERANCIHYTFNDAALRNDELVLVDAGGELGSYITDISRTWPLSGKFSDAQRELYEAVLKVQRSSVSLCRTSSHLSLDDIHRITVKGLIDQLKPLGFNVSDTSISQIFPHHVGHFIGLDIHDCSTYSRGEKLQKGHCVTIEPGIYVPEEDRWPAPFRGMGVRIEDSVCVDEDTPYILTTEAVKEVDDIEALRS